MKTIRAKKPSSEFDNKILSLKLDLQKMESKKDIIRVKKENLNRKEENFENIINEMHCRVYRLLL